MNAPLHWNPYHERRIPETSGKFSSLVSRYEKWQNRLNSPPEYGNTILQIQKALISARADSAEAEVDLEEE